MDRSVKKPVKKKAVKQRKTLDIALQGGGAHGAFTWGVLDRLLEEEDIDIKAISGTSAGAMNAAMLVDGHVRGGRDEAKRMLAEFWREVSRASTLYNPSFEWPFADMLPGWKIGTSAANGWFDALTRTFSPYELNPLNINPLRDVLAKLLHCTELNEEGSIKLFVTATQVSTGQARVFTCGEITIDVLLASACIPFLFQAVDIDGEDYWDGGYMGNPSIWPLIYNTDASDVLLVQINPLKREETPKTAMDIINRLNEITFNASLVAELRAIQFVKKLIAAGRLTDDEYKNVRMHHIAMPGIEEGISADSKTSGDWHFFQQLHGIGRLSAEHWLAKHKKDIGVKASLDVDKMFLEKKKPRLVG